MTDEAFVEKFELAAKQLRKVSRWVKSSDITNERREELLSERRWLCDMIENFYSDGRKTADELDIIDDEVRMKISKESHVCFPGQNPI